MRYMRGLAMRGGSFQVLRGEFGIALQLLDEPIAAR
jgi:hypothetical protein